MSQLDRSLDEASLTLGANSFTTLRRVVLPLLKPAIDAALVYSFVRSITSISARHFSSSAPSTTWRPPTSSASPKTANNGVAIAYSTMLIVVMICVIALFQLAVGKRTLRRETRNVAPAAAASATAVTLSKESPA